MQTIELVKVKGVDKYRIISKENGGFSGLVTLTKKELRELQNKIKEILK